MENLQIRNGQAEDANILRRVFEYASDGLSPYLWARANRAGQNLDRLIAERMESKIADPDQTFKVALHDGEPAGGILTYQITQTQPLEGLTPMDRSFSEVDNRLVGSVYVNALAVFPEFRRMGIASDLLAHARAEAAKDGLPLSLSVSDANPSAVATYQTNGFRHVGRVAKEKEGWDGAGDFWLLMVNNTASPWEPQKFAGAAELLRAHPT